MLPKNFVWRFTCTKSILQVITNGTVTGRIIFPPLQIPIDFTYSYLIGDDCEYARSRNSLERCCVLPQGWVFRRSRLVGLRKLVQKHFPDGIPAQTSLLGKLAARDPFLEHLSADHRPLSNVVIHGNLPLSPFGNAPHSNTRRNVAALFKSDHEGKSPVREM
jgi:hypothetical protein